MENLNAELIKKQMQNWSNGICENARLKGECLKGECLNGKIVSCENCMANTVRNALALINSQEQRVAELTEENERLRVDNDLLKMPRATIFEIADAFKRGQMKGKTDTVRKMQERLKAEAITIQDHTGKLGLVVLADTIGQIAKEMLEGEK